MMDNKSFEVIFPEDLSAPTELSQVSAYVAVVPIIENQNDRFDLGWDGMFGFLAISALGLKAMHGIGARRD
jgi:hypothetical protein